MNAAFSKYMPGARVMFIDENQHEIQGIIRNRLDFENHIRLLIDLDWGGTYTALLRKRGER